MENKEDNIKAALISLYDSLILTDNDPDFLYLNETTLTEKLFNCFKAHGLNFKEVVGLDHIRPKKFKLPSEELIKYGTEVFGERLHFIKWLHKHNQYWGEEPINRAEKEIKNQLHMIEYGGF